MISTPNEKDHFEQPVADGAQLNSDPIEELTWRYYLTPRFVGSYFALILTACNLYVSYNIPVRSFKPRDGWFKRIVRKTRDD